MFFVMFLMSWGKKEIVDSVGRSMGQATGRFAALK
jgi:hypothetical protein